MKTVQRMISKDLKKWANKSYNNQKVYDTFYKCKLISATLNTLYKQGKITKDTFKKLVNQLEDIPRTITIKEYEDRFLLVFQEWWNIETKKGEENK